MSVNWKDPLFYREQWLGLPGSTDLDGNPWYGDDTIADCYPVPVRLWLRK